MKIYSIYFRIEVKHPERPITVNLGSGYCILNADNLTNALIGYVNKSYLQLCKDGLAEYLDYVDLLVKEIYCNGVKMSDDYIDSVILRNPDLVHVMRIANYA